MGNKSQNPTQKSALATLCCPLPTIRGLAMDQLLPCLYWMVLAQILHRHLAAALITLILVQCPSFGFTVGLSPKQHLLWRRHQSRSGWVSINSVQGTLSLEDVTNLYQQIKRRHITLCTIFTDCDPMTILIILRTATYYLCAWLHLALGERTR